MLRDAPTTTATLPDALPATPVSDAERSAVHIDALDLDLHLTPADALEEARVTLTVRNTSAAPIERIPLQLSSTLRWQVVSSPAEAVRFTQSPIATDADHTGYVQEAVVTLAQPLAPGASLSLSALYAGQIAPSAARLTVLGVAPEQAAQAEWDAIQPTTDAASTSLRGLGHVLWYPVAAATALLGDTDKLPALLATERFRNQTSTLRLRLTVEYAGDPPNGVILDGTLQTLHQIPDEETTLTSETHGIATADFAAQTIGYRIPSLFLTAQQPETTDGDIAQLLTLVTPRLESTGPYRSAAAQIAPLLMETLGPTPLAPMLLLDHPGEAYEDHAFLAAQLARGAGANVVPEAIAPALVRPLTHAWFSIGGSRNTWLDQGLPELMALLYTERIEGREAAVRELRHASLLLALSEPAPADIAARQPLTATGRDVFLRLKSASVLWQLRDILGDEAFRAGLIAFRRSLALNPNLANEPLAFEKSLERSSGKDLAWFFTDWVYEDRGLPDLTIVQVNPRPLPARAGRSGGYLVAIEVRNDGDAVAEVPVTVRAGAETAAGPSANQDLLTATQRLRIAAHSTASTRIVFESTPENVLLNDGTVPELRSPGHTFKIDP